MKGLAWIAIAGAACGSSAAPPPPQQQTPPPPPPVDARVEPAIDAATIAKWWPDGCFTIRDASGRVFESDHDRCARARRPYSTFKIANALIAVDAGVLAGPEAAMTWDRKAVPDRPDYRAAWRTPHTLRSGFAVSAVPYFRTLALQLGNDRMAAGLAKLGYGNRDMTGGLDRFWLSGGLRISAAEQLVLVEALARGTLAVSAKAQDAVRAISELERAGGGVLHGKTGSGSSEEDGTRSLVWQVGWVERGDAIYPYACWMEGGDDVGAARAARDERLRATLDELHVFPRR